MQDSMLLLANTRQSPLQPILQIDHRNGWVMPLLRGTCRVRFALGSLAFMATALVAPLRQAVGQNATAAVLAHPSAVLWTDPGDIGQRNLFYGPGGEEGQPKGALTFLKEHMG